MTKYRDRLDIIADILGIVREGARKTHIMYMANLSYTLLTRYLTEVIDMGLVRKQDKKHYLLTEKGSDFLQQFHTYRKHQAKVEERVNNVKKEKVTLVNTFLNSKNTKSTSKNNNKKLTSSSNKE